MLAEPIVAAGWDRTLAPDAKAKVRAYATLLIARLSSCAGLGAEEAFVTEGVRIDQLSMLLESEIVIGRCEMRVDRLEQCEEMLRASSCETLLSVHSRGEIQQFCDEVTLCTDTPVTDAR